MNENNEYTIESIIQTFGEDAQKWDLEMEGRLKGFNLPKALAIMANELQNLNSQIRSLRGGLELFMDACIKLDKQIENLSDKNE